MGDLLEVDFSERAKSRRRLSKSYQQAKQSLREAATSIREVKEPVVAAWEELGEQGLARRERVAFLGDLLIEELRQRSFETDHPQIAKGELALRRERMMGDLCVRHELPLGDAEQATYQAARFAFPEGPRSI